MGVWHDLNYVSKEYLFLMWGGGLEDSMVVGAVLGEQLSASSWRPGQGCGSAYGVEWMGLEHTCWREPLELADGQDVGNEEKHNAQLSGRNSWVGSNDIYWDEEEEEKQVWKETKSFTLNVWSVR